MSCDGSVLVRNDQGAEQSELNAELSAEQKKDLFAKIVRLCWFTGVENKEIYPILGGMPRQLVENPGDPRPILSCTIRQVQELSELFEVPEAFLFEEGVPSEDEMYKAWNDYLARKNGG